MFPPMKPPPGTVCVYVMTGLNALRQKADLSVWHSAEFPRSRRRLSPAERLELAPPDDIALAERPTGLT